MKNDWQYLHRLTYDQFKSRLQKDEKGYFVNYQIYDAEIQFRFAPSIPKGLLEFIGIDTDDIGFLYAVYCHDLDYYNYEDRDKADNEFFKNLRKYAKQVKPRIAITGLIFMRIGGWIWWYDLIKVK